jgi:hypothetical protein
MCGLGIDVHQDFYVVVEQVEGNNPKPPQRFAKARWNQSPRHSPNFNLPVILLDSRLQTE